MSAESKITQGALSGIFDDSSALRERFPEPVCQCVRISPIAPTQNGVGERFRVVLSDIRNFVQCMLASQANNVVHDGSLKKGSFVRLKAYQANQVKGKRILIILDLEVITELEPMDKIGDPKALEFPEGGDAKSTSTTIASNGFYGTQPKQEPLSQNDKKVAVPTRNVPSNTSEHSNIYPIESLSPFSHKWTIKVRISSKSDIKEWHKQTGSGKLFSCNLLDESGEIKATAFNEQCDQLYDVFQEGSVYYISSPCRVQLAKKQFTNLPNDYELTFERDTVVQKAEDQDDNVPQVRFNFTSIADLQNVEKDSTIDVIGVLQQVDEVSEIVSKASGKPFQKRELKLVDNTGFSVRLTVWGKTALSFDTQPDCVLAFKGAKVSDFGGRSLSLLSSGTMTVDPDISEAHQLKGWYDSQGRNETFNSHSNMSGAAAAAGRMDPLKTVTQVKDENLGMGDGVDYFSTRATIVYIKQENFAYPACLKEGCNKKVTDLGDGMWRCEKCDESHPKPQYRYIMSLNVDDFSGQLWLSCFDEVGQIVLGMSADSLMELKENDDQASVRVFEEALFKTYVFKCRAKMDNFQDQQRVRYQVTSATPMNYAAEANKLAELIKVYNIE